MADFCWNIIIEKHSKELLFIYGYVLPCMAMVVSFPDCNGESLETSLLWFLHKCAGMWYILFNV